MRIYLPHTYTEWLKTTPTEGEVLIIALLTKMAYIYGLTTYLEFYNSDIDTINLTAPAGSAHTTIKKLANEGLIDRARGLDIKSTVRLAQSFTSHTNRKSLYTDIVAYQLSDQASLLWVYLMGRLAHVDENTDIAVINKIREFDSSRKAKYYRKDGGEKKATTHILPPVYSDFFTKDVPQPDIEPITRAVKREIHMSKQAYAKWYYQQNRQKILAHKKNKKTEANAKH